MLALFVLLAKNSPMSPARKSLKDYAEILGFADAWWLMAFYCVTFGGFVGLSSFLPIYFNDQYGLSPVAAGYCTAACVFAGSFVRPFGGAVADRIGGVKALSFVYGLVAVLLLVVSRGIPNLVVALPLIVVTMGALGAGNGAVFQIVPQRFARNVGVVTGLVGATGGVGGFYLAASLGYAKQLTGGYGIGLAIFAFLALAALTALTSRQRPLAPHLARPVGARHSQRLIPPVAGLTSPAPPAFLRALARARHRNPFHATRPEGSLCGRRDAQTATAPRHHRQRHVAGPRAGKTVRSRSRKPTRSRSSTPSRASTTTASCCRRSCRARRPSMRSSSMATAGTSTTASRSIRATASSRSTATPRR